MRAKYQVLCMSFDGEYKVETPVFDEIDKAWEYAGDLGSKWFFYPFYMVVSGHTVRSIPMPLEILKGRRVKTVARLFNRLSKRKAASGMDSEEFVWYVAREHDAEVTRGQGSWAKRYREEGSQ